MDKDKDIITKSASSPQKNLWDNIAALLKVKTIVTLVVIFVFAGLALTGKIQTDNVMAIVTMVIAFYFGTQNEKKS